MNMEKFKEKLQSYDTEVYFSRLANKDFKSFSKGKKNQILMLILKQAQKGADFKPKGNGNRLGAPLHQFVKIKSKAIALRIIYRPVRKNGLTEMQITAIGPPDKNKAYKLSEERIATFLEEMATKEE